MTGVQTCALPIYLVVAVVRCRADIGERVAQNSDGIVAAILNNPRAMLPIPFFVKSVHCFAKYRFITNFVAQLVLDGGDVVLGAGHRVEGEVPRHVQHRHLQHKTQRGQMLFCL